MEEKYMNLWGSMHDNPHHNQIVEIDNHIEFIKSVFDFWPVAYYPFGMIKVNDKFYAEDVLNESEVEKDWEVIIKKTKEENIKGFPMFAGFEWQGNGKDGDHNVFFLDNNSKMLHPQTYNELIDAYKNREFIAIPHHIAYHLGDRGKNWKTNNEKYSPFAEIYSSHGSSETDLNEIPMNRHIHMGPRVENTSYRFALKKGIKIGCICSGDNHKFSGQFDNGTMCVLSTGRTKEEIWDGLVNSRVYGVTFGRININAKMNGKSIGSVVKEDENSEININIIGDNAIDRIEVLKDEIIEDVYYHSGKWEREKLDDIIKIKTRVEFGWGPKIDLFNDITEKDWHIKISTSGKLISVQKNWNTFGQKIISQTENEIVSKLRTRKTTDSGKWMGNSQIKNEGFTLEFEGKLQDNVIFNVFGKDYKYTIQELIDSSYLNADIESVKKLVKDRYNFEEFYRNDTWWHNSYKFKIYQSIPEIGYRVNYKTNISTLGAKNVRIKIFQKNGSVAFLSPFFINR